LKQIQDKILKLSAALEVIIAIAIIIAILISSSSLVIGLFELLKRYNETSAFQEFLGIAFNLVIGIEFIRMLCRHNLSAVVEVLLFAIARQLIVEHTSVLENLVAISTIAILFLIRKYLFIPNLDDKK